MHAVKTTVPIGFDAIAFYLFLLPLSVLLATLAWTYWATDVLYHCTDPGLGILDIIPPFVHVGSDDVYLVSAWKVWLSWACLITVAFGLPFLPTWFLWRWDSANEP